MTDMKVSQLPAATAVAAADVLPIVQGGVLKKSTVTLVGSALGVTSGSGAPTAAVAEGTLYARSDGTGDSAGSLYLRNNSSWWPLAGSTAHGTILPSGLFTQPAGATVVAGNTLTDLQNAINATPVGGVCWIGARTIDCLGGIPGISKSITLLGNGVTSKITGTSNLLYISSPATNVIVRGVEFFGPGSTTLGLGVVLDGASFVHFERCQFHDLAGGCITGLAVAGNSDIYIIGCAFWNFNRSGLVTRAAIQTYPDSANNNNTRWFIIGNKFAQMTNFGICVAIGMGQTTYAVIDRNTILLPQYFGNVAAGGDGITCVGNHFSITNNFIAGNYSGNGILFQNFTSAGAIASDNYCAGNTLVGDGGFGPGILITNNIAAGLGPTNIVIENNRISSHTYGIQSADAGNGTNMSNIFIRNNDLTGNTLAGLALVAGTNATTQNNKLA